MSRSFEELMAHLAATGGSAAPEHKHEEGKKIEIAYDIGRLQPVDEYIEMVQTVHRLIGCRGADALAAQLLFNGMRVPGMHIVAALGTGGECYTLREFLEPIILKMENVIDDLVGLEKKLRAIKAQKGKDK